MENNFEVSLEIPNIDDMMSLEIPKMEDMSLGIPEISLENPQMEESTVVVDEPMIRSEVEGRTYATPPPSSTSSSRLSSRPQSSRPSSVESTADVPGLCFSFLGTLK